MPTATLTSKGQLTLPKTIRDRLRLGAGDRVDFVIKDDGTIVLRPATVDVRELRDSFTGRVSSGSPFPR